jgi:hypothetical protein
MWGYWLIVFKGMAEVHSFQNAELVEPCRFNLRSNDESIIVGSIYAISEGVYEVVSVQKEMVLALSLQTGFVSNLTLKSFSNASVFRENGYFYSMLK